MTSLSEFINSLAEISGVTAEDMKSFVEKLPEADVPEMFCEKFNKAYFTVDAAKNEPALQSHFKGKYLDSVDRAIGGVAKTVLPEEVMDQITEEKDSLKKAKLTVSKLVEFYQNELKTNSKGKSSEDMQRLSAKVNELNDLIAQKDAAYASEKIKLIEGFESERLLTKVNERISSHQFSDNFKPEDVKYLVQKKIQDSPYLFKVCEGKYQVYNKETPDTLAYKNNKAVQMNDVIDELASPYIKKAENHIENKKVVSGKTETASGMNKFIFGQHVS